MDPRILLVFTLATMTSHCLAFNVRRQHSDDARSLAVESALPGDRTGAISTKHSNDMPLLATTKEIEEVLFASGDDEGKVSSSENDLFEEIEETDFLTSKPKSKDIPKIVAGTGNASPDTSSKTYLNIDTPLEAPTAEGAVKELPTGGSGEDDVEESASGFGFTVTSNGEEDAAMRNKRNIQDAVDDMHACRYPTERELTTMLQDQVGHYVPRSQSGISHQYQNTCNSSLFDVTQEKREQRALCPYKMVTNVDNQRFPREISYASCACNKCVNSINTDFLPRSRAKCLPVTRQTEVLRRGQCDVSTGVYRFHKELIQVPVACVCTRTRSATFG
ncbi:uncharacterized protein LOC129263557 [Lytechinus pictus]|uniref:uncharacterized protein LOC129263557 n=1 Tax=Lytechinus pictus TaxID=7653 RepID=UPI0030B9C7D8